MITKYILPAVFIVLTSESFAASRIKCPEASDYVADGKSIEDYQDFFKANKIVPKTDLSLNYVEQFKNEFLKFPSTLKQELINAGTAPAKSGAT